ncbi:MAG: DUF917 domain-containing protein [Lactobacillus sp.]|jgi:DUF917 family protein|nr:DUF917 domain-containing protein [Lactobacillus sp.]
MRILDHKDVLAALTGGSVYACGGGGFYEHGLAMGHAAITINKVKLVSVDELKDDDIVITAAAIGAPGGTTDWEMTGRDYIKAAEMLIEKYDGKIVGFVAGQNGKSSSTNGWLPAAALDLVVVDALGDIRAHPSGKFGNFGLTSDPNYETIEAASGGKKETGHHIELTITGTPERTSEVLRKAADLSGGFFASARNPISVGFLKKHAVLGGYSMAIELGEVILKAQAKGAKAVLKAILQQTSGEVVGTGQVVTNNVTYSDEGTYDVGQIQVKTASKDVITAYATNEFMALDKAKQRVATYPDVITIFDTKTMAPLTTSEIKLGQDVTVFKIDQQHFPLSAGVYDPANYPEIEAALGIDIFKYVTARQNEKVADK